MGKIGETPRKTLHLRAPDSLSALKVTAKQLTDRTHDAAPRGFGKSCCVCC